MSYGVIVLQSISVISNVIIHLDEASIPRIDATTEVYCLQGAPSICSDLSTNYVNYGSWNKCDIITLCVEVMSVMSQSLISVAWQLGGTGC